VAVGEGVEGERLTGPGADDPHLPLAVREALRQAAGTARPNAAGGGKHQRCNRGDDEGEEHTVDKRGIAAIEVGRQIGRHPLRGFPEARILCSTNGRWNVVAEIEVASRHAAAAC
jgi:hypothetical protein